MVGELRVLLASHHGLLVAADPDEGRILTILRQAAADLNLTLWRWDAAAGLRTGDNPGQLGTDTAAGALRFIRDLNQPGIFVLADAGTLVDDPVATRLAKELGAANFPKRTIVLLGLGTPVPTTLLPVAVPWAPAPPDRAELMALVRRAAQNLANSGFGVRLSSALADELVDSLLGLSPIEAERLIVKHTVADGELSATDIQPIRQAKAELLSANSPLDLVDSAITLSDVGGLETLKSWLVERGRGFSATAREFGLPAPRGVLLTGVPGTGKSLIAKAIANTWGMAMVALDTGRLHGSYVGESEKRMSAALQAASAMAPVVVWIDEIEKAFQATDNDSGASARVMGVLLKWLQERPDGVFVIATSNDVTSLPPELTRRGRFDETFFVDLPDATERSQILYRQLAHRNRDPGKFELSAVVDATDGFSGAELESLVVGALYSAFAEDAELTTAHLVAEATEIIPLSVLRDQEINELRAWSTGRAIHA